MLFYLRKVQMKYFAAICALLLSVTLIASENDTVEFRHDVLGFSITYPKSWNVLTVDDYYNAIKKVKLTKEEYNQMLQKHASVPFFAISRFKEPYPDLNPTLKINTRPYGALKGQSLEKILGIVEVQFARMFKDFTVAEKAKKVKIGNQNGLHARYLYTLVNEDGDEFPCCSELWLIDRGEYFYMIGAGTREDEKSGTRNEVYKIIDSIIIK